MGRLLVSSLKGAFLKSSQEEDENLSFCTSTSSSPVLALVGIGGSTANATFLPSSDNTLYVAPACL